MMTHSIRAHFDGRVLVPDEPVDLPVGQPLRLRVEAAADASPPQAESPNGRRPLAKLADLADTFAPVDDAPVDLAAQVDHYLYGQPKQP